MGVPALFRWLSQKYPKIISNVIEERPRDVEGITIPVDIARPNPNGEEFDNLYLDFNGIVHPCTHPENKPPPANESEMMLEIFKYTDRVVNMVRPRKVLFIAVDGVAPRAKMNQQRSRRFRSALDAKQQEKEKEEFRKLLKKDNKFDEGVEQAVTKVWDSNVITPGTPFMNILALALRYWVAWKLNQDEGWQKLKVIISDASVPGEGEHKIMEFIRSQRRSPEHDPNTRHVMYGLDADLIMLGLGTHEPHFRILREDVFFNDAKPGTCRKCGQPGHIAVNCTGEGKSKQGEFDEKSKLDNPKPFIWLHVSILREYLEVEMQVRDQPFPFDLERALDDWVFMCFFVGNDFLPHLPSLDIREQGIDTLIRIWRDNIPLMGGYLTMDGQVNLSRAQLIMEGLAKQESDIFKRRRTTSERQDANAKRRKIEEQSRKNSNRGRGSTSNGQQPRSSPDYGAPNDSHATIKLTVPGRGPIVWEEHTVTHDMVVNRSSVNKANEANKNAAAALKSQLLRGKAIDANIQHGSDNASKVANGEGHTVTQTPPPALGKRKAELIEEGDVSTPGNDTPNTPATPNTNDDDVPEDTVRLWEEGYADRYYEQKFHVDANDIEFRHKVARSYVEGLSWVLLYYFQGCPSWTWFYPYHYAPFAADFVGLDKMDIKFEKGRIFKPYEQLMGVLPAASNHAIPQVFHSLMTDEDSDILDFYPEEFPIDMNGKKMAWQGISILPWIDADRLLSAMATKYPLLTEEEVRLNEPGRDLLLVSGQHPLANELKDNFYSKRQGKPKYTLNVRSSEGLSGKVEKNDEHIPMSGLRPPMDDIALDDVDEDQSLSVHYDMPNSTNLHKSMLLRGVRFPHPALDQTDLQVLRGKVRNTGRSYGGVPLDDRRSSGRGRGGPGFSDRGGYGGYERGRGRPPQSYNPPSFQQGPNPFAAHLDPSFRPPPQVQTYQNFPPPPPSANNSWRPPPPGSNQFARGPPPPAPPGSFSYGYGQTQGQQHGQQHNNQQFSGPGGNYGPRNNGPSNGDSRYEQRNRDSYRGRDDSHRSDVYNKSWR